LAEYQLCQRRISSHRTPSDEKDCPVWVQMGFALYRRLEGLGYKAYPVEADLQFIEVYPYASYCVLLERAPFPKTSLEGRIQRQLILYEEGLRIPDPLHIFDEITRHNLLQGRLPLDQLYSTAELDALVAAYSAMLAASKPEGITILGDPQEGQLVLPVAELKRSY
jgi:predicted RNase H-like nuclease